jgi:diguanylate cyclase (GGDEF)-like protein
MNLRLRTLLASTIATVLLVMGLSSGLSFLVLREISQMEDRTMSRRLNQTLESIADSSGLEKGEIHDQLLHSDRLQHLGARTLLTLRALPLDDPAVPAQLRQQLADDPSADLQVIESYSPKPGEQLFLPPSRRPSPRPLGRKRENRPQTLPPHRSSHKLPPFHAGYAVLRDPSGKPVRVLQAISPKPFTIEGEEGVKTLQMFLWGAGLLFGVVLNLLLDRWVLARLSDLSRQLKLVKADFSHATPVSLAGQDELSTLAADINRMLQQQELYQRNLQQAKAELEGANRELERMASTDGLTQIMNRRFFQINLEEKWQAALQTSQPLSLLLCDVDFFKLYNDTYGHLAGDLCLQKVAEAMSTAVKHEPNAIVARYGGEEFAAIFVNLSLSQAIALAEQMRTAVLALNIPHAASKAADCVTLSMGISSLIPQPHLSPRDLIARADEHLYQAKAAGRNRVIAAMPEVKHPLPVVVAQIGAR